MKKYGNLLPTVKEALEKGASFCAYRERCQEEVRTKLYELKYDQDTVEEVISLLIREGFIDEVRYAKAYAGGKFRNNKWGRKKIVQNLKRNKITDYCIRKGLEEISEKDYLLLMERLLEKKGRSIKDKNQFVRKKKLITYMLGKGFEYELITEMI